MVCRNMTDTTGGDTTTVIIVDCIDLTDWIAQTFATYDLPPVDAIPLYFGDFPYKDGYETIDCASLFAYINSIGPTDPGFYAFQQDNLCEPDPRPVIKSGGPNGFYPPVSRELMAYLCPEQCNQCTEVVTVTDETPSLPTGCDCWANGNDYNSFGWDPNPGCCYGCMDEDDWFYDDWATCHIQEACKSDPNGGLWGWVLYDGSSLNPAADVIGCEPADRKVPGARFEDRSQGRKNGPKLDSNGQPITR
jgi:hypothetical protein